MNEDNSDRRRWAHLNRIDARTVIFALLTLFLALNVVCSPTPPIEGDGNEYFPMSHGFLMHGDPSLQRQDLVALARVNKSVAPLINEALRAPQIEWGGYYVARNGKLYSYHYWLYSLVNVPALAAIKLLKLAPARSFLITNSLFILLAAFVLLYKASVPVWGRIAILLMFLASGTNVYLDWTGPEVFSASLVLVGFTLLLTQRPLLSALAFSAAAQQNAPIGILIAVAMGFWLWHLIIALRARQTTPRKLVPQLLGAAAITLFALQSPLFYWWNFRVPSLLTALDFASSKFITINRLLSYYFDLDQGLFRGTPFLLCALLAAFLLALARRSLPALLIGLALVCTSILMAIPSLTTQTWVTPFRLFLRYVYWGSVPLWFATVYFLRETSPRQRNILLSLAIICQVAWLIDIHRSKTLSGNLLVGHYWLSKYVIAHFPEYYNPDPYVFSLRTVRGWSLPFQPAPGLAYYFEHAGRISKVMYHAESRNNWIPECAATPAELEKRPDVERIPADFGWAYLNLGKVCPLQNGTPPPTLWLSYSDRYKALDDNGIFFGRSGDFEAHIWENQTGWGNTEEWGTWTDGKVANIAFILAQPPSGPLALKLVGIGRAPPGQAFTEAAVNVNGIPIGLARFATSAQTTILLKMPAELLARSSGIFHVQLQIHGIGSPAIGVISINVQTPHPEQ